MNGGLLLTTLLIALATSDFEFESYELPEDQGRRHTSPIIYKDTLYLAGGLRTLCLQNPLDFRCTQALRRMGSSNLMW